MNARSWTGAIAAAALLAGCGGASQDSGSATRGAVQRYFAAVGAGRAQDACAELTARSRERIAELARPLRAGGGDCAAVMRVVLSSRYGERLQRLARARITRIDVRGSAATATIDGVDRPLSLVREDGTWRIEFSPSVEADRLPGGPRD